MPMYDRRCENGHTMIDCLEPITTDQVSCPECMGPTTRVWLTKGAGVISDDIPGGYVVRHGLVNEDGSPMKFYSKSDMTKEAKRRGLVNLVEHVPDKGSDKSRFTTRWI